MGETFIVAILVPESCTTYGDATKTEGGPDCLYVLAQFRSDADLDFVARLRSALTIDELKWGIVRENRAHLRAKGDIWRRLEIGVSQATLIIVDASQNIRAAHLYSESGGELGVDYDKSDIIEAAAVGVIGGTPIAYLPSDLVRVTGLETSIISSVGSFAPADIQNSIGKKLGTARVFAARAYALFDVPSANVYVQNLNETYRTPASRLILREILATGRVFDEENPKSLQVLNRACEAIARSLGTELETRNSERVRERNSRDIDYLQAADVAAGYAREVIDSAGTDALGGSFERVWVNGCRLK